MPAPTITPLPEAPLRSQAPATFTAKAEAFVDALEGLPGEINAFAAYLDGLGIDPTAIPEAARDALAAALSEGAGIEIAVDDEANTITITCTVTQYTDSQARAAVSIAPTALTGATHTLTLGNANGYLRATNAAGCAITVPPNSSVDFDLGTVITFRAATAGTVSLIEGSGVTLNPPGGGSGSLDFAEEGATVQIKQVAPDEWDVIGGTAAG